MFKYKNKQVLITATNQSYTSFSSWAESLLHAPNNLLHKIYTQGGQLEVIKNCSLNQAFTRNNLLKLIKIISSGWQPYLHLVIWPLKRDLRADILSASALSEQIICFASIIKGLMPGGGLITFSYQLSWQNHYPTDAAPHVFWKLSDFSKPA